MLRVVAIFNVWGEWKIRDKILISLRVNNEVEILRSVKHPCVINLVDVIDTTDYLFIILELAEGGELFDKIIEKSKLDESAAKIYFFQVREILYRNITQNNTCVL